MKAQLDCAIKLQNAGRKVAKVLRENLTRQALWRYENDYSTKSVQKDPRTEAIGKHPVGFRRPFVATCNTTATKGPFTLSTTIGTMLFFGTPSHA
jgi:hypothetical protein